MACPLTAIADPARRLILRSLASTAPAPVHPEDPALSAPLLAEHLRVLSQAGLLSKRYQDGCPVYVLEPGRLHELAAFLRTVLEV
jgi:DNA-binding transcriptional ArsR family regulator